MLVSSGGSGTGVSSGSGGASVGAGSTGPGSSVAAGPQLARLEIRRAAMTNSASILNFFLLIIFPPPIGTVNSFGKSFAAGKCYLYNIKFLIEPPPSSPLARSGSYKSSNRSYYEITG
jgi:hypothetical protein